jgi:hypothetical protein
MLIRFAALLCAAHLVAPVVDRIPELDVTRICTASARARDVEEKDRKNCLALEQKAKLQLALEWARYAPADRSSCLQTATSVGLASYVEILTCLEMADNARGTPKSRGPGSLLGREGVRGDFQESCPPKLGSTAPELVPDSCF